jgi:glycosyltransferase involved in cell wall biosynthesis
MSDPEEATPGHHLVICNWRDSTHPDAGGAELYCEEVARHLHRLGARVTLLTSRPPGSKAHEEVGFGTVVRLGGKFTTYLRVLVWLMLHRRHVDGVIDSENGIPYFSPMVLRRRTAVVLLIHHVHQSQFQLYFPPMVARLGRFLEKWGTSWVYGRRPVCVVSPSARAEVRRQLALRGPIYIVPNGLTVSPPTADATRSTKPRIVYVGRLVPHKRLELLIDALPRLIGLWPELSVNIVGDGVARSRLEEQADALGLRGRVFFHGRVSQQERDQLISSAWLTVNSTAGEGWGLSVVEAAAHGVPAVAFRVPGMVDSVRHRDTGWLVDDGTELSSVIDGALREVADPSEADRWASRCRDWAAAFTWESSAERMLAVLSSERHRLEAGIRERRHRSDSTTVTELPRGAVAPALLGGLRVTDQVRIKGDVVEVLSGSADEHDVEQALERVGLPRGTIGARTRVARPSDLFGWVARDRFDLSSSPVVLKLVDESEGTDEPAVAELEDPSGQRILLDPSSSGSVEDERIGLRECSQGDSARLVSDP